jgi:hypothetical protein
MIKDKPSGHCKPHDESRFAVGGRADLRFVLQKETTHFGKVVHILRSRLSCIQRCAGAPETIVAKTV